MMQMYWEKTNLLSSVVQYKINNAVHYILTQDDGHISNSKLFQMLYTTVKVLQNFRKTFIQNNFKHS
jgi:hypothetical protein